MTAAFGRPTGEVFSSISPAPVAAASLGQVYRATLAPAYGGGEVAVKVCAPMRSSALPCSRPPTPIPFSHSQPPPLLNAHQVQRPDVLEQVALDLYIMRRVAVAVSASPDVKTDWAALIDSWAVRCGGGAVPRLGRGAWGVVRDALCASLPSRPCHSPAQPPPPTPPPLAGAARRVTPGSSTRWITRAR